MSTQSTQPPQIHDILTQILDIITPLSRRIMTLENKLVVVSDMQKDLLNALAKRRFSKNEPVKDTPESLGKDMQDRLDRYYSDTFMPLALYHLARLFSRRIGTLGLHAKDLLKHMPNVQEFSSGTGGYLLLPKTEWDGLSMVRRNELMGVTGRQLRIERQKGIESIRKIAEMPGMGGDLERPYAPPLNEHTYADDLTDSSADAKAAHEGTSA